MPFKSAKQRKYLYAKKPKVAKKLAKHSKGGVLTVVLFVLALPMIILLLLLLLGD